MGMMTVNLLGHCAICLKQVEGKGKGHGSGGSGECEWDSFPLVGYHLGNQVSAASGITSFQHIWPYLMAGKPEKMNQVKFVCSSDDDDGGGGDEEGISHGGVTTEVPPICEVCGEKVQELDRLHRELQAKVEEIKQIIKDTGGGGCHCCRRQNLEERLRNLDNIQSQTVKDTFRFLEHVSGTAVEWIEDAKSEPNHDPGLVTGRNDAGPGLPPPNDDWKLNASAVVPITRLSRTSEGAGDDNQSKQGIRHGRRRGPGTGRRKARTKTNLTPAQSLQESRYGLGATIKKEVEVDVDETNIEMPGYDGDIEMKRVPDDPRPQHYLGDGTTDYAVDYDYDDAGMMDHNPPSPSDWEGEVKLEGADMSSTRTGRAKKRPDRMRRIVTKRLLSMKYIPKTGKRYGEATCELCNQTLSVTDTYEHMRSHIGDFVLSCPNPKCPYACSNPRTLHREHVRNYASCEAARKKLGNVCETCGLRVDNGVAFRAHVQQHETLTKDIPCPLPGCGERFSVRQSVHPHIFEKHLAPKTIQRCALCRKTLDSKEMETHLKEEHQIQDPVKCRQCPFIFPDWEVLLVHLVKHRYGGLPCYICEDGHGPKFQKMGELRRHYHQEHQIGRQVVCDQCGKGCTNSDELRKHIRCHQDQGELKVKKEKAFKCDLCEGVAYGKEESLTSHNIRVHGADPFICEVCQATFNSKYLLTKHIQEVHSSLLGSSTKPLKTEKIEWPCDVDNCYAVYQTKMGLSSHKRSRHGIFGPRSKPFVCEFCSKVFSQSSSLKKHRNGVHFQIKKESLSICDTCGESFSSPYNLRLHKLIHSGARPFACNICDQAFRQKSVLDVHIKSHETLGAKFKPKGPMEGRKRIKRN